MLELMLPLGIVGALVGLFSGAAVPSEEKVDETPYRSPRRLRRERIERRIARRKAARVEEVKAEEEPVYLPSAAVYRRRAIEARVAKAEEAEEAARRAADERKEHVRELLSRRLDRAELLKAARLIEAAADEGKTEVKLISFPVELTTDNGRAINNVEFGSEVCRTLRGLPAEMVVYFSARDFGFRTYVSRFAENGTPEEATLILRFA